MDKEIFGNIKIEKMYPIEDCVFYTIGKSLKDEDINDIDTIKEFENKLDEKGINCIKIYTKEERIVYRQTNDKEGEQEIKESSTEFSDLCLKLFEYSKRFVIPNPTNTNSSGLPTILIKEYAKRQNGGRAVNYMGAKNCEDSRSGGLIPNIIHVENIEYNAIETEGETGDGAKDKAKDGNDIIAQRGTSTMETTGTVKTNVKIASPVKKLSNILNPKHKPLETYILGTQTHVSSFVIQDCGIYYLFDTTGCTHQMQQNGDQYYKSQLIFDKETSLPNGSNIQINVNPTILNPFGLDYQNGSSACGIWTSNVLAVASTYKSIKDFIMEDKTRHIAMFESEFILKVSAKVAKELNAEEPEVEVLKSRKNLAKGYCACKVGNTLFAIDTQYNKNSCLNMESILLSLSQKELEFHNVDHINDEIIKERKQLIERIEMEKTKCEKVINIMKTSYVDRLKKIHLEANKPNIYRSESQEKTKLELDELDKIESDIAELEKIEAQMAKLKIAELKQIELKIAEREKIELERIKSNIVELNEVEPSITELKKAIELNITRPLEVKTNIIELGKDILKKIELEKAKQKIDELENAKTSTINLEMAKLGKINSNINELNKIILGATKLKQIKLEIAKLEKAKQEATDKQETNKLEKINEDIAKLKEDEKEKQLEYYTIFTKCFKKIFDIKKPNIIEETNSYCNRQIKIIDNQLNHGQKIDELFKPNCIRIVHEEEKTPINNTKQPSDHGIGPRE